jgi:hypothetical protein
MPSTDTQTASIKAPTGPALTRWWQAIEKQFPGKIWSCVDCEKSDRGAYVQPQHPFYLAPEPDGTPRARCCDCTNARNRAADARRKAELAALPRCEIPGCRARGNWTTGGALICGRHLAKVKREHAKVCASIGGMALFMPITFGRDDVIRWASK